MGKSSPKKTWSSELTYGGAAACWVTGTTASKSSDTAPLPRAGARAPVASQRAVQHVGACSPTLRWVSGELVPSLWETAGSTY